MYLLLDARGLILAISSVVEYGTFENEKKWKLDNGYVIGNNLTTVNLDNVPIEIMPMKHYYINGEFMNNPNYTSPNEQELNIQDLKEENSLLKAQVEEHELNQAETELDIDERLCNLELGLV